MHDLSHLQRSQSRTRALAPIRSGVLAMFSQAHSVHPAPVAPGPERKGRALSFSFGPGIGAWIARGGNQINGEAGRVAARASQTVGLTAKEWGVTA